MMKILVLVSCLLFGSLSFARICSDNVWLGSQLTDVCVGGLGNSVTGYEKIHVVRLDLAIGTSDLTYNIDTSKGTITQMDSSGGWATVEATDGKGHVLTFVFMEELIVGKFYPTHFKIYENGTVIFSSKKVEFDDENMEVDSIITSILRDKGSR